ncbi:Pycsar system effector family protein [Pontivivens ytuae]|uniref:Pycsar effector protein domain-containing protein n=1 Tax=Pontivivens ytuae TaxID=2789856 RepID=A0A7S9QCL9_9RHOB|nr:Pycsar system effector family protein [Pontivivens ytuae]QPH53945.1 hypothetical protein I0K15_19585 [Pontivivens ytuae]
MFDRVVAAEKNLQRQIDFVARADHKLEIALGALIVIGSALFFAIKNIWSASSFIPPVLLFSTFCLIVSILLWLSAYNPRLAGAKGSLIFFDHIAGLSRTEFIKNWKMLTEENYEEDLLNQIFVNSQIARIRYKLLRRILLWGIVSAATLLVGFSISFW